MLGQDVGMGDDYRKSERQFAGDKKFDDRARGGTYDQKKYDGEAKHFQKGQKNRLSEDPYLRKQQPKRWPDERTQWQRNETGG